MFEEWMGDVAGWPWKDWMGPTIAAGITLAGVLYVQYNKNFQYKDQKKAAADRVRDTETMRVQMSEAQDMTQRFKILMDSYASRIEDLTDEVTKLKDELRLLRFSYEHHQNICRNCPNYNMLKDKNAAAS